MIWSQTLSLIVTGEMGWTPKLNRQGDRDPWNNLTPLVLASSGRKMGQVIGRSDGQGSAPATELYTPANLLATVCTTCSMCPSPACAPTCPATSRKSSRTADR
jgi:hypothetical protein